MSTNKRHGNRWTINEIISLQREYELLEWSVYEIAEKHQRTVMAIMSKLQKEEFIASWNDFFWPNIFISTTEKMTLPVGIASLVGVSGNTNVVLVLASVSMQIVPLLLIFLFTQRFLIQSIATTGIRG